MSRNRLTNRTAADMKSKPGTQVEDKGSGIDNDTAAVNNPEHTKNDPAVNEYEKGDPEAWAEGVNKDKVNKDDQKREETGHAPLIDKHAAAEAIASARKLEEKAVKAIIASQRMLPGATDEIIEKQAGILMHLPEEGLNATLANQESLAKMIAKAAEDSSCEDEDEDDKDAEKAAAEKAAADKKVLEEKLAALKKEAEEIEAKLDNKKNIDAKEDCKEAAAPVEEEEEEEAKKDVEAAAAPVEEEEKKDVEAAAAPAEEEEKKEVEASDASLLDQIFSGVMPSPIKKGASKLSGMVKKEASTDAGSDLASLWSSAPDVKDVFN